MNSVSTILQSLFSFYVVVVHLLCVVGLLGILESSVDGEIRRLEKDWKERRGRGLLAEVQTRDQLPQKCPDSGLPSPLVPTVSVCTDTMGAGGTGHTGAVERTQTRESLWLHFCSL